jgi:murein DD-endopeptidase MepM/ murein hydrolase activator NlpD
MSSPPNSQPGDGSATSLRFRLRQGEKRVERSSAQRLQSAIEEWMQRVRALFMRYATHLAMVSLALVAFFASSLDLSVDRTDWLPRPTPTTAPILGFRSYQMAQDFPSGRGGDRDFALGETITDTETFSSFHTAGLGTTGLESEITSLRPRSSFLSLGTGDLLRAPVFHTTIPKRLRRDVITYVVERGDTVGAIALKFDLEAETVMWANGNLAQNPDLLRPGQELVILPIDGVYHTVLQGETLSKIAAKYKAEVTSIIECPYNGLDPEAPVISPGDHLIIPGGIRPYVARTVSAYKGPIPADAERGTGVFSWPASGKLTDRYGFRTLSGRWHNGLDISRSTGAPVYAADSGFVTFAGWTDMGYGNLVVIDHRNGYETRYAHLQTYYVTAGQSVAKGTLIAAMGSTGNSTGPHLHFEIRQNGVRKNPEMYLP